MSLRAELETWAAALKAYEEEDFEKTLDLFGRIAESSKILTNMGLIYATLGEHEAAVEQFIAATQLDQYLAVAWIGIEGDLVVRVLYLAAIRPSDIHCSPKGSEPPAIVFFYFQCGVSNFLLGRYELALKDFEDALLYLRGNQAINYEQLGLKFRLYSAEVLFNKGLCLVYLGNSTDGLQDMRDAQKEKATEEHNVIDEAIADGGEGYTVFSIPVGILYRPPENKMRNAKPKDYLGRAKLVAVDNPNDAYTTFTGITRMQQGFTPTGAPIERPPTNVDGPPPLLPKPSAPAAGGNLARQNTTLNLAKGAVGNGGPEESRGRGPGLTRGLSMGGGGGGGGGAASKGPMRGLSLSVRRPNGSPGRAGSPPARAKSPVEGRMAANPSRLTEIYNDYLDTYAAQEEPPLPDDTRRVAAWAEKTQPGPPSRMMSMRTPPSAYGGSNGGGLRRRVTKRSAYARSVRAPSQFGDEDEFDGSDFDDAGFELVKIKVKIFYSSEVRGMAMTPDVPFEEFFSRVAEKFGRKPSDITMKFADEDGAKVSLRDGSDYDLAIETARESAKGMPDGKLSIWVE